MSEASQWSGEDDFDDLVEITVQIHHCIGCGGTGPFRSPHALKCKACDEETALSRKLYNILYHRARGRATRRLVEIYQAEFDQLFFEEKIKVEEEYRADHQPDSTLGQDSADDNG